MAAFQLGGEAVAGGGLPGRASPGLAPGSSSSISMPRLEMLLVSRSAGGRVRCKRNWNHPPGALCSKNCRGRVG